MVGCDRMDSPTGPNLDRSGNQTGAEGAVSSAAPERQSEVIPSQYIVVLNEQVQNVSETARGLAKQADAEVRHLYRHALKGFSAQMSEQAAEQLSNRPNVAYVEQDRTMHAHEQTLPTGVDRIQADQNSTASEGSVDADIAILDTGVDLDHPDLNVNTEGSKDFSGKGTPDDGNGHGTHVAGISAAVDNTIGVVGVAPGARIWAVKVLDDGGSGALSDIIAGVEYVTEHATEIEVANMSLGGEGQSTSFRTAIQNSVNAGVLYTVSAGNSSMDVYGNDGNLGKGNDYMPAAYPEVATISAMADEDGQAGGTGESTSYGEDDSFASFSNYSRSVVSSNPVNSPGAAIDLILPGVDIYSTSDGDGYETMSGTSMSSPHAAGLAALHIAANGRDENDDGSVDQNDVYDIRQVLIDAGVNQDSDDGLTVQDDPDNNPEPLGWAEDAVTGNPPTASWANPAEDDTVSGTITLQIDASDVEDEEGTLTVEWGVDGNVESSADYASEYYEAQWNSANVSDGSHTLDARVTDSDGNTTTATISVTIDNVNEAPAASFTYSCTDRTCSFDGSNSSDSDGSIASYEWEFGDESTATGVSAEHTYSSEGTYSVTLTVTDDEGATDTETQDVTVGGSLHVGDLDGNSVNNGRTWTAEVTVTVLDQNGKGVSGATVDGTWNPGGTVSAPDTTDNNGQITLTESFRKNVGETTFTVDNVTHPHFEYEEGANTDPDGDSDGTSITVTKP